MQSATRKRRRRFVRPLAIAGSAIALAAPATAGAMPIGPHNPPPMSYMQGSDQGSDAGAGIQQFGPGELTGGGQPGAQLDHRGLHYTAPASSTIREIRTVVHDDGQTLAIALAASALGIALCGAGYATVRLTQIQLVRVGS